MTGLSQEKKKKKQKHDWNHTLWFTFCLHKPRALETLNDINGPILQ